MTFIHSALHNQQKEEEKRQKLREQLQMERAAKKKKPAEKTEQKQVESADQMFERMMAIADETLAILDDVLLTMKASKDTK